MIRTLNDPLEHIEGDLEMVHIMHRVNHLKTDGWKEEVRNHMKH
jgi:hypothetical protein